MAEAENEIIVPEEVEKKAEATDPKLEEHEERVLSIEEMNNLFIFMVKLIEKMKGTKGLVIPYSVLEKFTKDSKVNIRFDEERELIKLWVPLPPESIIVTPTPQQVDQVKTGRNEPCGRGSGHKYKKCCLAKGS